MSRNAPAANPKWMTIVGWLLGLLPCLLLMFSAYMKLSRHPEVLKGFAEYKNAGSMPLTLGVVELTCAIVYLIPHTAVFGAILSTGYLGGAVHSHVRAGEPWFMAFLVGVVLWLGLYFRDPRIRSLLLRR
ncbi:MAG TPA: DoxX family protein [Phycisphaerales bacterium]|nr:DoxX family protein [Phycisphaerales bacterium]